MERPANQEAKITETLSLLAHQMKNPISVVKAYLEALLSGDCGKVNQKQKEYLKDALENIQKIKREIDEVLIAEMLDTGKFKLKLQPISLEALAKEVIREFSLWAKASNCQVSFQKPKKSLKAMGDLQGTRWVIENFLSNSLKYSLPSGQIEISIFEKGDQIVFSCKDKGISIPEEDFDKVFTKFYRSEKAMEIEPSSSGLGLYINKKIIEGSGGKIWFEKNKDFGTTFYFSLPQAK